MATHSQSNMATSQTTVHVQIVDEISSGPIGVSASVPATASNTPLEVVDLTLWQTIIEFITSIFI